MCSDHVKIGPFCAYCTLLHTASLQVKFKRPRFLKIRVAYLMCKFICRLNELQNSIIKLLVDPKLSVIRYQYPM